MSSVHDADWPQIWKAIRIGSSGAAGGPSRLDVIRRFVGASRRPRLSSRVPAPKTSSVPTRITVASALTSGVTPNLIWV